MGLRFKQHHAIPVHAQGTNSFSVWNSVPIFTVKKFFFQDNDLLARCKRSSIPIPAGLHQDTMQPLNFKPRGCFKLCTLADAEGISIHSTRPPSYGTWFAKKKFFENEIGISKLISKWTPGLDPSSIPKIIGDVWSCLP